MIGPSLAGSSLELLRAKVLKGEYPVGYKPKRATPSMAAIPSLTENDIVALEAFINSK
jgi:hypothetical protein